MINKKQQVQISSALAVIVVTIALAAVVVEGRRTELATNSNNNNNNNALPKGCSWTGLEGAQEKSVTCKVRTLSKSETLLANLSVNHVEKISALRLECSEVMLFESSLEPSVASAYFLGNLKFLQRLDIEYCKIRYVPAMVFAGVSGLVSLTLRTKNTDWNVMNLELHPESFRGLTELKSLNLADNNIWSVPTEVFCPLYTLKVLNLTGNQLNDVSQLSFSDWGKGPTAPGKACNTGLESLDLSKNDITLLPDNGFTALRSLSTLLLQDNLLTEVADRSFVGLQYLSQLNMANNKIIALPPELFQSSRKIRQIFLQNNSIAVLAPGLLEGLDQLEVLELSHNELTSSWINRDTFAGLIRLIELNLAYNKITKIDRHVFRGLYSLQILDLGYNVIESLADNSFTDLKNLQALTLSNNRLKTVNRFDFSELYVLKLLLLESNQIEVIDERAFENLTHLHDLSLNDNKLQVIPTGMKSLRFLKSLDLGKNQISDITTDAFEGLEELLGLRLVDNLIANISRDTFSALPSLRILNLASNEIRHIDQSAFISNPAITGIRLDHNQLDDISSVFTSLSTLVWLNVSDNQIRNFDYSHFPDSLQWLDMRLNKIAELGNYFDIRTGVSIKTLDVSYNRLTKINAKSIPDNIESLFLNNNLIDEIEAGTFAHKANLTKVVLNANKLRLLDMPALSLPIVPDYRNVPEFYLGDNLLHCDCKMEWLHRINELSYLRQYPRVMDLDSIMCTMEHSRGDHVRPLAELTSKDFVCKYEHHCFALCHCCDFDACDCKMTCPAGCTCYHDPTWSSNIVDCGGAKLTEVPKKIPMDVTELYLDGNNLGDLQNHMFIGKKRMERLYLNDSLIERLDSKVFNGLTNLKVLHLENNALTKLVDGEFGQLTNLNELYLDHNAIGEVDASAFNKIKYLEVLTLDHNKLANFRPWEQIGARNSFKTLALAGISVNCDCRYLVELKQWFDGGQRQLLCSGGQKTIEQVIKECEQQGTTPIATPTVQRTLITDVNLNDYLPLLIAVIIGLVVTILLITLVFIFKNDFRLWAHAKYGVRLCKDPLTALEKCEDHEKLYDAYVIYGAQDSDSVQRELTAELEHLGYNLCLHYRDLHSQAFLADSLQSAADASRKLILFLSMNFLRMEWSHPEFHGALQAVLELIRPTRRAHKLIIITTCPHNVIAMDPIWDILLRTCTVIAWDDRRFWDRLRYSMPDINRGVRAPKKGVIKATNLRYAPAPTNSWVRRNQTAANIQLAATHISPSNSNCPTEDEMSSASSQHYESPTHHQPYQYCGRPPPPPNLQSGHVYSTIPEAAAAAAHYVGERNATNPRPCFV